MSPVASLTEREMEKRGKVKEGRITGRRKMDEATEDMWTPPSHL